MSVFECFVPSDSRMPAPHSHDAFEETIYGLEGVTSWTAVASPGGMGPDYFPEIHEVLAASGGGPPDPAKLGEVMRRHGLTPAPAS